MTTSSHALVHTNDRQTAFVLALTAAQADPEHPAANHERSVYRRLLEVYFQPKFDLAMRRVNSMDLGGMQISINISPLQIRDPNLVGDILAELNKAGVSTEQLALISGLGCDEIQGYLISRPLPASDITAFLQQQDQQRLSA